MISNNISISFSIRIDNDATSFALLKAREYLYRPHITSGLSLTTNKRRAGKGPKAKIPEYCVQWSDQERQPLASKKFSNKLRSNLVVH